MKAESLDLINNTPHAPIVRTALAELQNALRKIYGSHAPALLVYGSYARGEASTDSDVDVLLLYSREVQPGHEIQQLQEILSLLNLRYQVLISVLPVGVKHYQTAEAAFWRNVKREAVSVDSL
jgi:predicted nucleotidyltransferase